jgi:hypothetical protein
VGEGEKKEWESGRVGELRNYQLPMPNSQCPIPNAQFPIPNSPFPQHSSVKSVKSRSRATEAELPSRIKFQKELEFACEF